jgi:tRNA U34 5-carboxymethylaminomethyl modifying enzyme MnmG/GidA
MKYRAAAVLVLLAAALVSTGCGNDAKASNAYVTRVQQAQRTFADSFTNVRQRLAPTSTPAQDRRTLAKFAAAARLFATQLKDIAPPQAVRRQHAHLVAVVARYELAIERAERQLTGATKQERASVSTDLASSVQDTRDDIGTAINAINTGLRG